jgi:hypothetical protein
MKRRGQMRAMIADLIGALALFAAGWGLLLIGHGLGGGL